MNLRADVYPSNYRIYFALKAITTKKLLTMNCDYPWVFYKAVGKRRIFGRARELLPVVFRHRYKRESAERQVTIVRNHLIVRHDFLGTFPPSHDCARSGSRGFAFQGHSPTRGEIGLRVGDSDIQWTNCKKKKNKKKNCKRSNLIINENLVQNICRRKIQIHQYFFPPEGAAITSTL